MGAPFEFCSRRGVVAVLASGVVISLTALTGGIAPAFAQPGNDQVLTTTVAPEPEAPVAEETTPQETTKAPAFASPAAPLAPQTPAPQIQAPQTQAPQTQAPQTQAPKTQASEPPTAALSPPVTSVEPAEPSESATTTAKRAPVTESAPSTASTAPPTATAPATATADAETSASSTNPSAALAPGSQTGQSPASSSSEAPTSESTTRESETEKSGEATSSKTPTVSISQAAKEIETVEPQTLAAPEEDVQLAKSSKPVVEQQPAPAAEEDVAAFSSSIETSLKIPGLDIGASAKTEIGVERRDVELVSNVRQWRPEWVQYDEYYRPIILNPFRAPVRIVYIYDFRPRIMIIPPLAQMVLEAAQFAAYSFTAAVLNPINAAIDTVQALSNIAVGSFFGGGYYPGIGMPLPPPPPPVLRYDNVPVLVNYSNARYEPFRVRQIVDVGDDAQFGERKVLLDGATPAWGVWTQTSSGERQFEVHRTQQFPGLDNPQEGPLPGDYRLRLASDESSTGGFTGRDIFLFVAAGVIGTLGFGAIGLVFFLGRRRPQH